jgi:hypothetical protein
VQLMDQLIKCQWYLVVIDSTVCSIRKHFSRLIFSLRQFIISSPVIAESYISENSCLYNTFRLRCASDRSTHRLISNFLIVNQLVLDISHMIDLKRRIINNKYVPDFSLQVWLESIMYSKKNQEPHIINRNSHHLRLRQTYYAYWVENFIQFSMTDRERI